MSTKTSLLSLFDRIDWQMIEPSRTWHNALRCDQVSVGFLPAKITDVKLIKKVKIRVGKEVWQTLGWKKGDKIHVSYDPDDVFHYLFAKSDSGAGFALTNENKTNILSFTFNWLHTVSPTFIKARKVKFETSKGRMILRFQDNVESN
jgi:hypothetical protein